MTRPDPQAATIAAAEEGAPDAASNPSSPSASASNPNSDPNASNRSALPTGAIESAFGASSARGSSPDEAPVVVADRYEIVGMLGAGGMGTVYRARDRELDEIVALKVLRRELASAPGILERFRREVKLARRVTHRNVARTFDIGEHEGDRFLTMEFVEGEMLGSLLARRGRLSPAEVVRITLDVCAGLGAAHDASVLHRDLKPENVILASDGRAIVTDFGIARAAATSGAELGHTAGGFIGTPAYMAPEQVEGRADLDARTDLYALGAMLFELLTGDTAWKGDSVVAIAAARLLHPPPDPRTIVANLPPTIAGVVTRLMARDRAQRFASAAETAIAMTEAANAAGVHTGARNTSSSRLPVSSAFPSPTPSGVPSAIPSGVHGNRGGTEVMASGDPSRVRRAARMNAHAKKVAVLPLANLGAKEDAYLADSVTEDIVDHLSVDPSLLVRPRGDTARFVGDARDVREAGRALGVDVVVDGSLRRIGEHARVSVRLVTVEDGFQLWAKRFDRPAAEVLAIADEAAVAIARALTSELEIAPAPAVVSPLAQELFLRGRWLANRGWFDVNTEALDLLARARELAPGDARIAGAYALALARSFGVGSDLSSDLAERARIAVEEAIALDPARPEGRVGQGILQSQYGDIEAAVRSFRRALAVAPNMVEALQGLGPILAEVGRPAEGLAYCDRATAIEPDFVVARLQAARIRAVLGDEDAVETALTAMPSHPADAILWILMRGRQVMWRRDREGALRLAELIASMPLPPRVKFAATSLVNVTVTGALTPEAHQPIRAFLATDASRPLRRVCFNAQIHAEVLLAVSRPEEALAMLKIADAAGFIDVLWIDRCPLVAPLRGHPDFATFEAHVRMRASRIVAAFDRAGTATATPPGV